MQVMMMVVAVLPDVTMLVMVVREVARDRFWRNGMQVCAHQ